MKFLFLVASLFATAQAQFFISIPTGGTALVPGQNFQIQIHEPIDTSAEAGEEEVSLVVSIVPCGTTTCPAPSADLGEILFIGKYQPQGVTGSPLETFENFTFVVPSDISGAASIQVQHNFLTTLPGPKSEPGVEYANFLIDIESSSA